MLLLLGFRPSIDFVAFEEKMSSALQNLETSSSKLGNLRD